MAFSEKHIPYHNTVLFFISLLQLAVMVFLLLGLSLWSTKTPSDVYGRVEQLATDMKAQAAVLDNKIDRIRDVEQRNSVAAREAAAALQVLRSEIKRIDVEGTRAFVEDAVRDRWHKTDEMHWQQLFFKANPHLKRPKIDSVESE